MYGCGGRKREIIYLSLYCHQQNDSCIKMGSDTRQCPQITTFEEKEELNLKWIQTKVPLFTSLTPYH